MLSYGPHDWRAAAAAEYADRRANLVREREMALERAAAEQQRAAKAEADIAELDKSAKVFGLELPTTDGSDLFEGMPQGRVTRVTRGGFGATAAAKMQAPTRAPMQFKDIALEQLAAAFPAPLKAAEVAERAEKIMGRQFHWKTAGMTLYRLKTEGAVRRDGQNWYYVPPDERVRAIIENADRVLKSISNPQKEDQDEDLIG